MNAKRAKVIALKCNGVRASARIDGLAVNIANRDARRGLATPWPAVPSPFALWTIGPSTINDR